MNQVNLKRRRFLELGIGGTLLVVIGGGALKWFDGGYAKGLGAGEVPIALSEKELVIVKSIVRALLPAEGGLPSGESLGVHQRIDEELWSAPESLRDDMKAGLQLFEHAPVVNGFGARFTALDPNAQRAYFSKLLTGSNESLRQVASGMKQIVHLFYYARPETWKAINYEGPLVPAAVPPESHVAYQALLGKKRAS